MKKILAFAAFWVLLGVVAHVFVKWALAGGA